MSKFLQGTPSDSFAWLDSAVDEDTNDSGVMIKSAIALLCRHKWAIGGGASFAAVFATKMLPGLFGFPHFRYPIGGYGTSAFIRSFFHA